MFGAASSETGGVVSVGKSMVDADGKPDALYQREVAARGYFSIL
jgi:hypothetical protein